VDVFRLRRRLVDDYGSYVSSFIRIRNDRIEEEVTSSLGQGLLWPDPLIQLNPSFEAGETIDELVAEGVLHEECARVFRRKRELHDPGEATLFPENEVETKNTIPSIEEAALALHACVPNGEKVQREKLLLDAARELGDPKLTRKVRRALNKALNAEKNAGRLKTDWERVWRPKQR
jgi:hypothetical protein